MVLDLYLPKLLIEFFNLFTALLQSISSTTLFNFAKAIDSPKVGAS